MQTFISTVAACADEAKNAHTGDHDIALSFDEWGVWYSDVWNQQEAEWKAQSGKDLHHESWPKAPRLLEDIYNAADAVVEGSLMITLLKHCDRVRSASRAQLVNVIAPIMAEKNGPAWRQTVFYPFAEAAQHAHGIAYSPVIDSPNVETESFGLVNALDSVITWDETNHSGLLLMVNRDASDAHKVTASLSQLPYFDISDFHIDKAIILHDDNPYQRNSADDPTAVTPQELHATIDNGSVHCTLPAISWAAVEFHA